MAYLVVLLGFGWPWERAAKSLRARFPVEVAEFFGRDRPRRWEGRKYGYRDEVTQSLVTRIFGEGSATGFCGADGTCAIGSGRWSRASCKQSIMDTTACARRRPQMLIFVCHPNCFDLFFEKFARAVLFMRASPDVTIDGIGDQLGQMLPTIKEIRSYLANLSRQNFAPLVPFNNFQRVGGEPIAADAQANLTNFCDVMAAYHRKLYSPGFQNQRKKFMRGAYMIDDRVGFQRDLLHSSAQLGSKSRRDGYHLLNAFHMYGFPVKPGFHFDVSATDGGALGYTFRDMLDGGNSDPDATHVNLSPCDRIL